jgi:hypothetical protein
MRAGLTSFNPPNYFAKTCILESCYIRPTVYKNGCLTIIACRKKYAYYKKPSKFNSMLNRAVILRKIVLLPSGAVWISRGDEYNVSLLLTLCSSVTDCDCDCGPWITAILKRTSTNYILALLIEGITLSSTLILPFCSTMRNSWMTLRRN